MIDHAELRRLATEEGFPRLSLYIPTERKGRETRQGPIQLKNVLREAENAAIEAGLDTDAVGSLLAGPRALLDDYAFWQQQEDGLALFVTPAGMAGYRLPVRFDPAAHLADRFHLRPLLPLLARGGEFYLLALSQGAVRLYRGGRYGMEQVEDPRLPDSAAARMEGTQFENAVGFHPSQRGSTTATVHALGDSPEDQRADQLDRYVNEVAKVVDAILAGRRDPLVLAADDRLLGMLRRHLQHPGVIAEALREHPVAMDEARLHEAAWSLVSSHLDAERRAALERFEARRGAGEATASDRIVEIAAAAAAGRVDTLIVASGGPTPAEAASGTAEAGRLIEQAVIATVTQGGTVHSRPADRADSFPDVAALYRY